MSLTIEDKQFIQNLFEPIIQRIDGLESRFDKLEARFDKLEVRFDKLELRFDKLESKFNKLEVRFDKLEKKVDKLDLKIDMTRADVRLLHANFEVCMDRINEIQVDLKVVKNDVSALNKDRDNMFKLMLPKQVEHEKRILKMENMLLSDSKKV